MWSVKAVGMCSVKDGQYCAWSVKAVGMCSVKAVCTVCGR